jgi:hypothetical protein
VSAELQFLAALSREHDNLHHANPTCTPHGVGRSQLDSSARIIAITIITSAGRRDAVCRLITTVLDPDCPTVEIIRLYHEHWEIETRSPS